MSSPIADPQSEEEIQFASSSPDQDAGFLKSTDKEEKMEVDDDDDIDELFTEAQSDLDDSKRSREAQSPPKALKKARDATTGAPSPNSRDNNTDEELADAEEDDDDSIEPPTDPAKVDISKTPHKPRKDYVLLLKNLPEHMRIMASTTYSSQTGEPTTSPSQVTPKVHRLLQRVHQQTRSPDLSIPLQSHDRQKALVRILKNDFQDDEDQPELLSID